MKFLYEYRTKDNAVHSGVVSAPTRDEAYSSLKAQGVRPSRLTEAPGFFNHLFGKGKRWLTIGVLCALCLVLCVVAVRFSRRARASRAQLDEAQNTVHEAQSTMQLFDSPTRRYPIGDAAVIEKGIRTGWTDVFTLEGDRFLASFAVPGEPPAIRSTTVEAIEKCLAPDTRGRISAKCASPAGRARTPAAPDSPTTDSSPAGRARSPSAPDSPPKSNNPTIQQSNNSIESRQIRAIVSGMKDELRRFLAAGGSITQYGRLLVQRQNEEIGYLTRAKNELDTAIKAGRPASEVEQLWEANNVRLRKMGIRSVPMPE